MKVGSLVEALFDYHRQGVHKGNIYTVSHIFENPPEAKDPCTLITLHEVHDIYNCNGLMGYDIVDFREIQPPMDISELVKESINEPAY